jgi:hypothetical protein
VFGPDKRMTLSEALCDDLAAVEAGLFCPLPKLDASGRQLLLLEPCRHTREGYTSESMVRSYLSFFNMYPVVRLCASITIHLMQLNSSYCSSALFGM